MPLHHIRKAERAPSDVLVAGALEYPIACRARIQADIRGEPKPMCTWVPDDIGHRCTKCGTWAGEDAGRGAAIKDRYDRAGSPVSS